MELQLIYLWFPKINLVWLQFDIIMPRMCIAINFLGKAWVE